MPIDFSRLRSLTARRLTRALLLAARGVGRTGRPTEVFIAVFSDSFQDFFRRPTESILSHALFSGELSHLSRFDPRFESLVRLTSSNGPEPPCPNVTSRNGCFCRAGRGSASANRTASEIKRLIVDPSRAKLKALMSPEVITEKLNSIARRRGIRLILLFGSAVERKLHRESDLDLGVLFERVPEEFRELSRIQSELQSVFPDREVDLSIINRADPLFLKKMLESCRLLYGAVSELHRLKIYAFRRYQDHRRFLELESEFARRFIREVNPR